MNCFSAYASEDAATLEGGGFGDLEIEIEIEIVMTLHQDGIDKFEAVSTLERGHGRGHGQGPPAAARNDPQKAA